MKIIDTSEQWRKGFDFVFTAKCESCGHEIKNVVGKDTKDFRNNILPRMRCGNCGLSSKMMEDK